MEFILPDLCDNHPDEVQVLIPGFRNFGGRLSFCGPASTIKCHEDNSSVAAAVQEPGAGRVLMVDGGGSLRCALLGDQLAMQAAVNGWHGIVIDGCVRDVDALAEIELGVQALAANPRRSVKRHPGQRDETVTLGGVSVVPGAWVYADNNGILVANRQLLLPG